MSEETRDARRDEASPESAGGSASPPPYVIGIGASAGGVEALGRLFDAMEEPPGVPIVVVVHLSPDQESHLAEILDPHATIPVRTVTGTTRLESDTVHVIPPGLNLELAGGELRLSALEERAGARAPIDHFFAALAADAGEHAIGIVLTGAGTDGTTGLGRIREAGGITIAQDPEQADHQGMPSSAISAGVVDRVVRLEEMPDELARLVRGRPVLGTRDAPPSDPADREGDADEEKESQARLVEKILVEVRRRTGRDFDRYKRRTLARRIERRMQLQHVDDLGTYLARLRQDGEEAEALVADLLISVTEFFRDAEVFERLQDRVTPDLFDRAGEDGRIRVWSVGCATGEEAYSTAMLLAEEATRRGVRTPIQIFATDIHDRALDAAREGIYPREIEERMSVARLRRFFTNEGDRYRIARPIREMVIFAEHDVLSDPPFSHLDLVVCRNVLIYLRRDVQSEVIDLFHYVLNRGGWLLLGTSETIARTDLFDCVDGGTSLHRRRDRAPRERAPGIFADGPSRSQESGGGDADAAEAPGARTRRSHGRLHEVMAERYAPPSVLVDPAGDVPKGQAAENDRTGVAEQGTPSSPRVLVVDDHAVVRQGLVVLLAEDERVRLVGEAKDGGEVEEAIRRHRPDVVLMDVNMPGVNGIEAKRRILEVESRIRVIGLSVQNDAATGRSMREAGAAAFVSKSDDAETIIQTILRVTNGVG